MAWRCNICNTPNADFDAHCTHCYSSNKKQQTRRNEIVSKYYGFKQGHKTLLATSIFLFAFSVFISLFSGLNLASLIISIIFLIFLFCSCVAAAYDVELGFYGFLISFVFILGVQSILFFSLFGIITLVIYIGLCVANIICYLKNEITAVKVLSLVFAFLISLSYFVICIYFLPPLLDSHLSIEGFSSEQVINFVIQAFFCLAGSILLIIFLFNSFGEVTQIITNKQRINGKLDKSNVINLYEHNIQNLREMQLKGKISEDEFQTKRNEFAKEIRNN